MHPSAQHLQDNKMGSFGAFTRTKPAACILHALWSVLLRSCNDIPSRVWGLMGRIVYNRWLNLQLVRSTARQLEHTGLRKEGQSCVVYLHTAEHDLLLLLFLAVLDNDRDQQHGPGN